MLAPSRPHDLRYAEANVGLYCLAVIHPSHPTRVHRTALPGDPTSHLPSLLRPPLSQRMSYGPGGQRACAELGRCMSTHPCLLQCSVAAGSSSSHLVALPQQPKHPPSGIIPLDDVFLALHSSQGGQTILLVNHTPLSSFSLSYLGFYVPSVFLCTPLIS